MKKDITIALSSLAFTMILFLEILVIGETTQIIANAYTPPFWYFVEVFVALCFGIFAFFVFKDV